MTRRTALLGPLDLALLAQVRQSASLVDACERLHISRDRGGYRLRRMSRALGQPVVVTRKGGLGHGSTILTTAGAQLLRGAQAAEEVGARVDRPNRGAGPTILEGLWEASPRPSVRLDPHLRLFVGFEAREGERVRLALEPESVLVAERRFPTSARNVLAGVVRSVRTSGPGTGPVSRLLGVRVGETELRVAVTDRSVKELHLVPGRPVWLYVKATALQRVPLPTRGV